MPNEFVLHEVDPPGPEQLVVPNEFVLHEVDPPDPEQLVVPKEFVLHEVDPPDPEQLVVPKEFVLHEVDPGPIGMTAAGRVVEVVDHEYLVVGDVSCRQLVVGASKKPWPVVGGALIRSALVGVVETDPTVGVAPDGAAARLDGCVAPVLPTRAGASAAHPARASTATATT